VNRLRKILALPAALAATVALAEEAPPVCWGMIESGMVVHFTLPLGNDRSGIIAEAYYDARSQVGDRPKEDLMAAPPELRDFHGVRVVHCASGRFMAVPHYGGPEGVSYSVAATEFLRDKLRSGSKPSFRDIQNAVDALYPGSLAFRETAETCGCNAFFSELRPVGMTPFDERDDLQ